MIVAAVRQTADWLGDATHGVNALLASVPGDVGDTAPPNVTIYDATRQDWVARGVIPRGDTGNVPLLLVRGPDEAEIPLWAGTDGGGWGDVEVRIAYVRRPGVTRASDDVLTQAYQTLRAAARSLQAQFQTMQAGPTRQGVLFERPRLRFLADQETLAGNETILASLAVTFGAFDPWVLGATIPS